MDSQRKFITRQSEINAIDDFINKCKCSKFPNSLHRHIIKCKCSDFRKCPPLCLCVAYKHECPPLCLCLAQVHLQLRRILPRRKKVLPRNPRHRWRRHIQLAADCSTQAQNSLLIFAIATLEPNVNDFINKCKCSTFSYYQHSFHFIYFRLACKSARWNGYGGATRSANSLGFSGELESS